MGGVAVRGLRKAFGDVPALADVSFAAADGEFFCLLGPSGAGKTTTLKCIAGLEQPDAGGVYLDGEDITRVEPYDRGLAMAFENYALYPQYTVYRNLTFPLRSKRHRVSEGVARERATRVAETLGIAHLLDRMPAELSGGQRQRVALGRVLVRPAEAHLLDEPLSHLDAKLRAAMRAELKALGSLQRTTTIYVTHDYVEALALGDRIGVIRAGRVVQVGTREQLWNEPVDTFVARAVGRPEINLVRGEIVDLPEGRGFRSRDGAIEVPLPNPGAAAGTPVLLGVRPRDLDVDPGVDGLTEAAGVVPVKGRVYVVEPLGRQYELTVEVGDTRLVMVGPRDRLGRLNIDAPVTLLLPRAKLLFFADTTDGTRITEVTR